MAAPFSVKHDILHEHLLTIYVTVSAKTRIVRTSFKLFFILLAVSTMFNECIIQI